MNAAESASEPATPATLGGRWTVDRVLSGAMGTVLLVTDPASGVRYAAKTPSHVAGPSPEALARFAVEARTWLSLGSNRHVVEAFFLEEVEYEGSMRPFLFLEYVDGPSLDRVLAAEGPLAIPVVLDLATGVAWGMAHAHGEGRAGPRVVHRDLKPENVFLTTDRVVKVSDFGIARALDRPDDLGAEGVGAGTPYYMAPEQLKDARAADRRSDVYSYGALVHELLTGRPPFPADSIGTLVFKVLREPATPPSRLRPGIPPDLDRLVLACLEKDPARRPPDFRSLLLFLSDIREIDALWIPDPSSRSCAACGWLSLRALPRCTVCGSPTAEAARYAPTSHRSLESGPTLGRTEPGGSVVVEGVTIKPRRPRVGDEVVVTVLLGNPGAEPVEDVVVPFTVPDRDAFFLVRGRERRRFVGTLPPTAEGAPLRVSWSMLPLRAGEFCLKGPRAYHAGPAGVRRQARGPEACLDVQAADASPLIGREVEMEILRGALADCAQGEAGAILVTGRAGIGKSRLARELRSEAARQGFLGVRGRCLDRGDEVRGAIKDAARQILRLPGRQLSEQEIAAALVGILGDTGAAGAVVGAFVVDELLARPLPRGASPAEMWARFWASAAARQRSLVVLEDVESDPEAGTVALAMARLARRDRVPLLVLLTSRPQTDDPAGTWLESELERDAEERGGQAVLRLPALTPAQVRELVDLSYRPNDFATTAPWLGAEVARRSGGIPLYAVEILRALSSPGADEVALVVLREGAWTVATGLSPEHLDSVAPDRLEEVVLAGLRSLPEPAQRFAAAAAALGDVFETALLVEFLGSPPDFGESLAALEAAGVLREQGAVPPRIRFREPFLPEVLRRRLRETDPKEHARLHRLAAGLASARPDARGRGALRLARHRRECGEVQAAFSAFLDATARLVDRQAYGRARLILDEAASALGDQEPGAARERVRYRMLQGEVLRFSGDLPGALDAYRDVVESGLLGQADPQVPATVFSKMGRVHETLGQLDEALYCYSVGLALREESDDGYHVPMSLANLAGLHLRRGEVDRARDYLLRATQRGAQVGNLRALCVAHTLAGRLFGARGETVAARRELRDALRTARGSRTRRGAADAWSALGDVNLREGRVHRALRHYLRALGLRQAMGDLAAVAESWTEVGTCREAAGELSEAAKAYRRAVDVGRSGGTRAESAVALTSLGRVQLREGELTRGAETLRRACQAQEGRGSHSAQAVTLALTATAERYIGLHESSAARIAQALALADGEDDRDARAIVLLSAAEAEGSRQQALRCVEEGLALPGVSPDARTALLALCAEITGDRGAAEEAEALAARSANPKARARALAARGRVELEAGDVEAAAQALRRATAALTQSGDRDPFTLRVLRDQAAALERTDPAAAQAARSRAAELAADLVQRGLVERMPLVESAAEPVASPRDLDPGAGPGPGGGPPGLDHTFTVLFPNDLSRVPSLRERFVHVCVAAGLSGDDLQVWQLVFTELVCNSLEHACDGPEDQIEVSVSIDARRIEVAVTDPSVGVLDPGTFLDASDDGFLETGRGAGLFLIRSFTDEIHVEPGANGGTRVRVLRLRRETGGAA